MTHAKIFGIKLDDDQMRYLKVTLHCNTDGELGAALQEIIEAIINKQIEVGR